MNSLNCAAVRFKIKYLYGFSSKYKRRGWFSLMWGQSITLCFIWSCHKSLTALMYAPHPPPPPPSPSFLSPCLPCSDPSYTLSLSRGEVYPLLHFPTWNKTPFWKCSLYPEVFSGSRVSETLTLWGQRNRFGESPDMFCRISHSSWCSPLKHSCLWRLTYGCDVLGLWT